MRKYVFVLSLLLILSLAACNSAETPSESSAPDTSDPVTANTDATETPPNDSGDGPGRILVVYFTMPETDGVDAVSGASRVVAEGEVLGNTQLIAQWISDKTDGDLFTIETVQEYPGTHDELLDFANNEQANNERPELAAKIENLEDYDTIFVGFPNWWYDMPMPLYSFFDEHDFSGKTIIPFNTHGGSRFSDAIGTIADMEPDATVIQDGLTISRNDVADAEDEVTSWLNDLGFTKAPTEDSTMTDNNQLLDMSSGIIAQDPMAQTIYLWDEGNMPHTTVVTEQNKGSDPIDFRPSMTFYPANEGLEVKGAVMICAGGAFQFRGPGDEAPVAEGLNALGYHCFAVSYRLRPYTQEEGALDLARAVRFVRSHAEDYQMDGDNIAVIGFSAGGIQCGEMLLNFDGLVNGTALDASYIPDELDKVSADASAASMIYSFYGRLSVASLDVEKFAASDLPPTYFLYGSEEVFRSQIEANAEAVAEAGVSVTSRILDGWQHGFGGRGDWFGGFDQWLSGVFENN